VIGEKSAWGPFLSLFSSKKNALFGRGHFRAALDRELAVGETERKSSRGQRDARDLEGRSKVVSFKK